jgi:predicted RNA binding protein YcfA (HicA-like mRNA interferase family)/predicted RNase H-like HicB family nuclease
MKVSEIVPLLEQDGWALKRTTGSHRHFTHRTKPGLVTVAGKPSATLKPKTEASILKQAGLTEGASVRGYVVVFEGDDDTGYSAYSPDLPGVVAAGDTRAETEQLMREAMAEHIALLRQNGEPVPEPAEAAGVTILDPAAA